MNFLPPTSNIDEIAEVFWKQAGGITCWPCDLEQAVALVLPLDVVVLCDLTAKKVETWFQEHNTPYKLTENQSRLHGCVIMYHGNGIVFIDGADPKEERFFTLAHETSHFILDYLCPRLKAYRLFGSTILDVLDGLRAPSLEEQIESVISLVCIKPQFHLLEHDEIDLATRSTIWRAEERADELALELIAPAKVVLEELECSPNLSSFDDRYNATANLLNQKFGLPAAIADSYARNLIISATGGPSVLSFLGLE